MTIAVETFSLDERGRRVIRKDPDALLDYSTDWSQWLAEINDTVSSHAAFAAPGSTVAIEAVFYASGVVTSFVSGGAPNNLEPVTHRIATVGGRSDDRTFYLKIVER